MENTYVRLSERLNILLDEIESKKTPLSFGHITEIIGSKSFGILLLFLSMPSSLPIVSTGFATLFAFAMCTLLIQMFYGREVPWLPEKVKNAKLSVDFSKKMLKFSIKVLKRIEGMIHPRLNVVCTSKILYIILFILACIIILPFPFTNTAPALVIFLCSIGLIEADGFICLISALIGIILIACYFFVFYLVFSYGFDVVLSVIKNFFHIN